MTTEDVGSPNDFMLCYWFTKILLSGHCLSGTAHCCWHAAHIYHMDKTEWSRVLEDTVSTVWKSVSTSCIHPWWYVPVQYWKLSMLIELQQELYTLCRLNWPSADHDGDGFLMCISRILFTLNLLHLVFFVFAVRHSDNLSISVHQLSYHHLWYFPGGSR